MPRGALFIAGTTSDAGKSVLVAGLCRYFARQGVKVAPFKAQNMSLNSAVTRAGAEIGRAQATQAAAAFVEPEAAMNPVLLKPSSDRCSQLVVMGQAVGTTDALRYQQQKAGLRDIVLDALSDLRSRYDVVICEGAGSPTEINLRANDLANMGVARAADLPVVVVGDIERGGVFASLFGTLALLEPADQALVSGFVINKFRGVPAVLAPGLRQLTTLTGRPALGVVPWTRGLWLDAEDALALGSARPEPPPPIGPDSLDVAVVPLPQMSNFTDVDALAVEPGVRVRFTDRPADLVGADLAIVPGTKATVRDLEWLRMRGLATALAERADRGAPVLGICGGYQMLGATIADEVESRSGGVRGLGLLPVVTSFAAEKMLGRPAGICARFGNAQVNGYEIHHGRSTRTGGSPLLRTDDGADEGCTVGAVLGTSWHGLLESDELRRALLSWVAQVNGREFTVGTVRFEALRQSKLDVLGDLIARHTDHVALAGLVNSGAPAQLPVIPPAGAPPS